MGGSAGEKGEKKNEIEAIFSINTQYDLYHMYPMFYIHVLFQNQFSSVIAIAVSPINGVSRPTSKMSNTSKSTVVNTLDLDPQDNK